MFHVRFLSASFGIAILIAATGSAGTPIKSGPQVGQEIPGPFHPLVVTGESAGKKECLEEKYGSNPVAMIFAREINEGMTALIKRIDAENAKNKKARMFSFVVFLTEDDTVYDALKHLAVKNEIKHTVLAIDSAAGPKAYKIAKEAETTIVFYVRHKVVANHAFRKGELDAKAIESIITDIPRILPAK